MAIYIYIYIYLYIILIHKRSVMKPIIFLLMLFVNGYSYIHLIERVVHSF